MFESTGVSADEGDRGRTVAVVERDDNQAVGGERAAEGGVGVFGAAKAVGEERDGPAVGGRENGSRGEGGDGGVEEGPEEGKVAGLC